MRHARTIAVTLAFAGAAWGCAEAAEDSPEDSPEAGPPAAAGAALAVASTEDGGVYLTDAAGRALYVLEGEPRDSVTCYDECAQEWPPFAAGRTRPAAGSDAVRAELVSVVTRREGRRQVAYNGHPLYYYHDDREPGQTAGHDVHDQWGGWYLVGPDGEPVVR